MKMVDYSIDGALFEMAVEGATRVGDDRVLLEADDDLTRGKDWSERGFVVTSFLPPAQLEQIRTGIRHLIVGLAREVAPETEAFELEHYHERITDPAVHAHVISRIRPGFPLAAFPIDAAIVEARVSEIVGVPVIARNRAFGLDVFNLRVVRPGSRDNNPLHRDVWLDRLRNAINIFGPIAACDEKSSLCVIPGSHRWKESHIERTETGATVDGLSYTVPAVVGAETPLALTRPNPGPAEVLVFSPYLVHGGAVNQGLQTRVSLEMRFWRAEA